MHEWIKRILQFFEYTSVQLPLWMEVRSVGKFLKIYLEVQPRERTRAKIEIPEGQESLLRGRVVHYAKSRKAFKCCEFENYEIKLKLTFFFCERGKVVSDHFVAMRKHVLGSVL